MEAREPKIRFKGFTDPWEQRKLGELCDIVGGGTPSTAVPEYWDGEIDWYSPAEIGESVYADGSVRKITDAGYSKCSAQMLPANRTILFTSRAGIGDMAILRRSGCTNQGFQSLVVREPNDPYFFYSTGGQITNYALTNASGSTFLEISGRQLERMDIAVPNEREQRLVGSFFAELDNLITLHQRKLDSLENVKKSMLDKMFPKPGESIPEIRFKGFTDPWEQRKFAEVVTRISEMSSSDEFPQVEYEDINSGEGTLNKNLFAKESRKTGILFDSGDVLYGKLRPYLRNWLFPQFEGIAVGDFWVLRPENADGSFIYRLIQSDAFDALANVSSGSKMPRADWALVSQAEFGVPTDIEEQRQIGSFFAELDNLITLHQRKLDSLKNVKKSLLEKMFA